MRKLLEIRRLVCGLLFPCAVCGICFAQGTASVDSTLSLTTTSTLVLVPALVKTNVGTSHQTFRAEDFILTDNGVPQHVTLEDVEHQPIAVVVLLQTGGAASRQIPYYAKLGTMLTYLVGNAAHRVALVTFDSQPEEQWDFTADVEDLQDGFTHPGQGDDGAAILDAVSHGIELLQTQPASVRRVLLVVSQTHDDGSKANAQEIVRRLGENNITIECLTFSPEKTWVKDQFTRPRHENKPYDFYPDGSNPPLLHTFDLGTPIGMALNAMRKDTSAEIAKLSGGESLPFGSKAALEQQFVTLANHFAASLTLSFRPTSKEPGFHSLQLRVANHPEMQVSARSSYWVGDASTK